MFIEFLCLATLVVLACFIGICIIVDEAFAARANATCGRARIVILERKSRFYRVSQKIIWLLVGVLYIEAAALAVSRFL